MGQSSQLHRRSGIHILKISSNFYILLVSLRGANPENVSLIALFVQILWPFEYFRVHLIFLVMQIFSILGSSYQKFSNLLNLGRYSLKYMLRLLQETVQNIEFQEHKFFLWILKNQKKVKNLAKKVEFCFCFFLIYEVFLFVNGLFKVFQCSNPDSML